MRSWGGKDGSIIVVSHDKSFCDSVGFTAVGTVADGKLVIEERDLNDNDWKRYAMAKQTGGVDISDGKKRKELSPEEKEEQDKKRKRAFNAPKRIKKIEEMIEKSEVKTAEFDQQMLEVGTDVLKLTKLNEEKIKEEAKIADLMEEWEELEVLLEEFS